MGLRLVGIEEGACVDRGCFFPSLWQSNPLPALGGALVVDPEQSQVSLCGPFLSLGTLPSPALLGGPSSLLAG